MNDLQILNSKDIKKALGEEVEAFIKRLHEHRIGAVLIGGAVRDWLLTGHFSSDLDFEIYPLDEMDEETWIEYLKYFGKETSGDSLDYHIHRYSLSDFSLELAPARVEHYRESTAGSSFGHSEFEVNYLTAFNPRESFLRRDLTLNALGLHFIGDDIIFVDPFNGFSDLKEKKLVACSSSFELDPVRFVRMIRFSLSLGFDIGADLKSRLVNFNLENLTSYYFFSEGKKGNDFISYAHSFFSLLKAHNIKVNTKISSLSFFANVKWYKTSSLDEVLWCLYLQELKGKEIDEFVSQAQIKKNKSNMIKQYLESLQKLKEINLDNLEIDLNNCEDCSEFIIIRNFYRRHKKMNFYPEEIVTTIQDEINQTRVKWSSLLGLCGDKSTPQIPSSISLRDRENALIIAYLGSDR